MFTVTVGSINKILVGSESSTPPIVQVLSKQILVPRCTIRISDSVHYVDAVFSSALGAVVEKIVDLTYLKLVEVSVSLQNNQKKILIIQMKIIGVGQSVIGSPSLWKSNWVAPKGEIDQSCSPIKVGFESPKRSSQGITEKITNISDINQSLSKFTLKARVTLKSDTKSWKNNRGGGVVFNLDLIDSTGEIHCTFYNEAATQYDEILQVGKVYYFYNGRVKPEGKFNPKKNDFEMTFWIGCEVFPCDDTIEDIPVSFESFKTINEIQNIPADTQFDIVVALKQVSDAVTVPLKKDGSVKNVLKRDVILMDNSGPNDSGLSISLVLWGNSAEKFVFNAGDVIVIRNARATTFNGRSLSASANTQFMIDDSLELTKQIKQWLRIEHPVATVQGPNYYPSMSIAEARECLLKDENKSVFFRTVGTVFSIKHDSAAPLYYNACVNSDCLKKVVYDQVTNLWTCDKCNQSHAKPNVRYILSVIVADFSGSLWTNLFNEVGEVILSRSAASMQALKMENDSAANIIFQSAASKSYVFKIKLFNKYYQDEFQQRSNVVHVETLDYVEESTHLLEQIQEYV